MRKRQIMNATAVERLKDDLGPYRLKLSQIEINGESYYEVKPVGWMVYGLPDSVGIVIMLVFILKILKIEIGLS